MANYNGEENDLTTIMVNDQPIITSTFTIQEMAIYIIQYILIGVFMMTALFTHLSASFVMQPIEEKQNKSKLLQLMTGLSSTCFWLANLIFDMIYYLIVVFLLFVILFFLDSHSTFLSPKSGFPLFLTLFMFGFAAIPFAYVCSLYFQSPDNGFQFINYLSMFVGFMAVPTVKIATLFIGHSEVNFLGLSVRTILQIVGWIVGLIPIGSMSFAIQKIYFGNTILDICKRINTTDETCRNATEMLFFGNMLTDCCPSLCQPRGTCYDQMNYFGFTYGVTGEILIMLTTGLVLFTFVCLYDDNFFHFQLPNYKCFTSSAKPNVATAIDSDVYDEQNRIFRLEHDKQLNSEALAVIQLKKLFGKLAAVDEVTFGVHQEVCFGLLGVNGAGKTTTFRMLVGDLSVTSGNAYIYNISLNRDLKKFQQRISYCPQFDALNEYMTVHETIELFAMLRGIANEDVKTAVGQLVQMVDLQDHVDKQNTNLSGGNKRKLSLAVAIIGSPPIVFLDEPTTGVDPAARRKIWSTLVFIQDKLKCSVILTSHSMDECEALCSRIAIMVNGQFQCLGSSQHLKAKFGQGFQIQIKLKSAQSQDPVYLQNLSQMMLGQFPSAVLKEHHQTLLHYQVTDPKTLLSDLFRKMEQLKTQESFDDYTVSDTNLEQVFLMFARRQEKAEGQ